MATPEKIIPNPFQVGGMVRDRTQFIGRNREMREILSRLATMQSVSIHGERLIGKSSLLHQLVAEGRQRLDETFEFFYLDLQPLNSAAEFYALACKAINGKANGNGEDVELTQDDLRAAIENRRVVLCLDEFERTIEVDFGAEFFNVLRSLAQTGNLALVVATKRPLSEIYRQEDALTSSFSNIFTSLWLGPLTGAEVEEFLQTDRNGFSFTPDERDRIRRLAGTHPYWLNVACAKVFEARQRGQVNLDEIERQFNAERAAADAPAPQPQAAAPVAYPATAQADPPIPPRQPVEAKGRRAVRALMIFSAAAIILTLFAVQNPNPVGFYIALGLLLVSAGAWWMIYLLWPKTES